MLASITVSTSASLLRSEWWFLIWHMSAETFHYNATTLHADFKKTDFKKTDFKTSQEWLLGHAVSSCRCPFPQQRLHTICFTPRCKVLQRVLKVMWNRIMCKKQRHNSEVPKTHSETRGNPGRVQHPIKTCLTLCQGHRSYTCLWIQAHSVWVLSINALRDVFFIVFFFSSVQLCKRRWSQFNESQSTGVMLGSNTVFNTNHCEIVTVKKYANVKHNLPRSYMERQQRNPRLPSTKCCFVCGGVLECYLCFPFSFFSSCFSTHFWKLVSNHDGQTASRCKIK